MATKMATTIATKVIDTQRWICRTQSFKFNGTSSEDCRSRDLTALVANSVWPRQHLLEGCEETGPSGRGAAIGLLLVRPEARLLHAQPGARAGRGQGPGDDAL